MCGFMESLRPRPLSVLDVGFGHGKWGFLAREYIHREYSEGPHLVVDGIDVFEGYVLPHHRAIYDRIIIGDAVEELKKMEKDQYSLCVCCDVIEHLSQERGSELLDELARVGKRFALTTPKRFAKQGKMYGNEAERHVSFWTEEQLQKYGRVRECGFLLMLASRDKNFHWAEKKPLLSD
jgi:SAM-dependent methyltransferase